MSTNGWKCNPQQLLSDTLVLARLVIWDRFPDMDLPSLTARFLSPADVQYDFAFKDLLKQHKAKNFGGAGFRNLAIYGMNDVRAEAKLYETLKQKVITRGLWDLWKMQQRLTATLFRMEDKGMYIDVKYCKESIDFIDARRAEIISQLDSMYGASGEINYDSATQLTKFFKSLGVSSPIKNKKSGTDSWKEEALQAVHHPAANLIKEYRTWGKLGTTYFKSYLDKMDSNHRIHPVFKNWGTVTGRLASSEPNVQNLPKTKMNKTKVLDMEDLEGLDIHGGTMLSWMALKEEGFDDNVHISVRRAFIPPPGKVLWGGDYSQMEMRMFFAYLNNPTYNKLVSGKDWDAHDWVVEQIWGLKKNDPDFDFYRGVAKTINFGLIYGIGLKKLAPMISKTISETKEFRDMYFSRFPEVKAFQNLIQTTLVDRGWVKNRYGRRYSVSADRAFVLTNYLIQGSCGDYVSERMNAVDDLLLDDSGGDLLSQVHDELVYELDADRKDEIIPELMNTMEQNKFGVLFAADPNNYAPSLAQKAKAA